MNRLKLAMISKMIGAILGALLPVLGITFFGSDEIKELSGGLAVLGAGIGTYFAPKNK